MIGEKLEKLLDSATAFFTSGTKAMDLLIEEGLRARQEKGRTTVGDEVRATEKKEAAANAGKKAAPTAAVATVEKPAAAVVDDVLGDLGLGSASAAAPATPAPVKEEKKAAAKGDAASAPAKSAKDVEAASKDRLEVLAADYVKKHAKSTPTGVERIKALITKKPFSVERLSLLNHEQRLKLIGALEKALAA